MQKTLLSLAAILYLISCNKQLKSEELSGESITNTNSGAVTATVSATGICDYDLDETTLTSTGWSKIFEDNFSTDLSNWNIWTGGAFNNELQYYQAPNLVLSNGVLNIVAKKETVTGATTPFDATPQTFNYTSGRIESKILYSASSTSPKVRMISRIKLPPGYGMWPAFWSYGDPWPTQGEIDILEARGQEPFQYQTNYFYGRAANRNLVRNASTVIISNVNLQTCWHVYELIWAQNSLTFLLDGQIVDTKTGGYVSNLFGKKEKITLNAAVGGAFFTNLDPSQIQPGTMQVDWVKVFKSN
ncbi:MAG: glycoside hydrolase family 16 protein [Sphingobacteriales bacterium]|nr:glycoside hydrolase family 16 protein [Sphingobacteriales bacterium]